MIAKKQNMKRISNNIILSKAHLQKKHSCSNKLAPKARKPSFKYLTEELRPIKKLFSLNYLAAKAKI